MKVIMLMFDSLNRHMLPPYGPSWLHAPNFERLARRTVIFDNSYVCSMPCMPARRDLHTGRPNFLHRSWGPIEPFDDSVPRILREHGVSSHLITDHYHYFEAGGATYHTNYSTWQFFRGQEGDPFIGQIAPPVVPESLNPKSAWHNQDWVNRSFMAREEEQPQSQTFNAGIEFLKRNHDQDKWFLHMETFDPHEPFFTQRKYKDLYAEHYESYKGPHFDWPKYRKVEETPEQVEHLKHEYAALVSMCDAKLGDLLDTMDALDLWKDTMLVVWTDHGFLLGEHDSWAKCWRPFYEEVAHTPFFIWDPRSKKAGERRSALVQPSIDLGPTLLDFFDIPLPPDMLGKPLGKAVADDTPVREAAIFGMHGAQVNVTDGRYVYMRSTQGEKNEPLNNYTLMPTHMRDPFGVNELKGDRIGLAEPFSFTKGCRTMKIPSGGWIRQSSPTLLFDVKADPKQERPLNDPAVEKRMIAHMVRLMKECDAPPEQYERLGLPRPG
ncbi:MAG: sulfatase [Planctomycetota bacterium]|nr:sulfatase [Planctomycetota bacterium]